ncbi:hypothetical protein AVEN_193975-1 [Araneus ventricosus]|uniref:Uncharacterized protein n=1 Tax=Araneus ventricosus TaxID=182803 RepID=A0A4Y2CZR6_ARAVE|nr:hypothetical protein AVEN_193975-1 [Araneus ventricosus]
MMRHLKDDQVRQVFPISKRLCAFIGCPKSPSRKCPFYSMRTGTEKLSDLWNNKLLHMEIGEAHNSVTEMFWKNYRFSSEQNRSYSPDLALCDFFISS